MHTENSYPVSKKIWPFKKKRLSWIYCWMYIEYRVLPPKPTDHIPSFSSRSYSRDVVGQGSTACLIEPRIVFMEYQHRVSERTLSRKRRNSVKHRVVPFSSHWDLWFGDYLEFNPQPSQPGKPVRRNSRTPPPSCATNRVLSWRWWVNPWDRTPNTILATTPASSGPIVECTERDCHVYSNSYACRDLLCIFFFLKVIHLLNIYNLYKA